jgi:hypothetical protein
VVPTVRSEQGRGSVAGRDAGGGQVCVADDAIVEGKHAVRMLSEFETKRSLDKLVAWLTPDDWPTWGSSMFKEMRPLTSRTNAPSKDGEQWHANYPEVVSLAGQGAQHRARLRLQADRRRGGNDLRQTRSLALSASARLVRVCSGGRRPVTGRRGAAP